MPYAPPAATRSPGKSLRRLDRSRSVPWPDRGDRVKLVAGDVIPADGEVIEGIGSVDESAI
ncbi:MAG UNVERIFIED_CONTAM: hypothetical protein LVR29_14175 [Microcystis novacekii LVE1205-3]